MMGFYRGYYLMPTPNDAGVMVRQSDGSSGPWPVVNYQPTYAAAMAWVDSQNMAKR